MKSAQIDRYGGSRLTKTESIANKPKRLSHVEAAALPLVGVSAWRTLVENIGLSNGQRILIHGGAGGIGSIAIQLAKYFGAFVATTVSANDKAFVQELGADHVIDYKSQNFEDPLHSRRRDIQKIFQGLKERWHNYFYARAAKVRSNESI
jgi:NADPH:quinone reductase-like Zn-dependent oxidoreductase